MQVTTECLHSAIGYVSPHNYDFFITNLKNVNFYLAITVLLAYAIAQLEMKKRKLKTPEDTISATKASEQQVAVNKKGTFTFLTHDYSIATT